MDRKGTKCTKCRKGTYEETSIHDDWDGKLHCSSCKHEVSRHTEDEKKVQARIDDERRQRQQEARKKQVKEDEDLPPLTFKSFLRILGEDLEADVSKLRADISAIDAVIIQRTKPLHDQKSRLQRMLSVKEKQLVNQQKKDAQQEKGAQGGNALASAPGSTGAATPGGQ